VSDELEFVDPAAGRLDETFAAFVYGPPKNGKTVGTLALAKRGPLLVVNSEGPNALRYARRVYGDDAIREVAFRGEPTFVSAYRYARQHSGELAGVVFDSLGEMYRVMLESLAGGPGKKVTLPMYGQAQDMIERYVRVFRDLPLISVWVAHDVVSEVGVDQSTGDRLTKTEPWGIGKRTSKLPRHFDLYTYVEARVEGDGDEQRKRFVGQLTPAKGRDSGDRYGGVLGLERDFDLAEWADTIEREFYGRKPATTTTKGA
jgi:hypothetical protein